MKFRAFISVDIVPNETLASLFRELGNSRADLKIVRPELLHLTLKFLGDTDESLVDEVALRLASSTAGVERFTIKLKGMGAFPSMSNIRVVWVGIEDGRPLTDIASKLDESLKELGFEKEKRGFVPHLTLARVRTARNIANVQEVIRENAATDYGDYLIDRVLLKKSVLSPKGPTYSVVREQLLGVSQNQ